MGQLIEFTNNHPLLVAGTILMGLAVLFYEIRQRAQGLTAITPGQSVQLINSGARVIDVREPDRFAAGHIVDAINLPGAEPGKAEKLRKNKAVILVCDNGGKSSQSVAGWREAGYEQTFSLKGGLAAWQQDNLPTVSET